MYKRIFLLLIGCVLACAACPSVFAQRQTSGRPSIDGKMLVGVGSYKGPVYAAGGEIDWCNYRYLGHTAIGFSVLLAPKNFTEPAIYSGDGENKVLIAPENPHDMESIDMTMRGGYYFRLLSTRSRSVILSAGVCGNAGISWCKQMSSFVKDAEKDKRYGEVGFLLGVSPELLLEFFPFQNASLYLSAEPRIDIVNTLACKGNWFRFYFGAGFKYYL